jgi:UDP-N-acetylglucosamine--N-acetylmuramyl-(pentapeptide) pyrophosphoryl-undecaprenol N-acetylglucosamine transferase
MRCSISGGGTGGHIYPALAVARALLDVRPDAELSYIGGARGFEQRLVAGDPLRERLPYHQLMVRSLRSAGRDVHLVLDPLRLAGSVPQATWLLRRLRPQVLFTTGGYLALPLVLAARGLRIPSLVWEGNVVPGRATRAVGRIASRVAVSFPPTLEAFDRRAFVSGTPIRSLAGIDREAARASFGIGPDERLLLAFGGSQAVARFADAITGALDRLLADWTVLHITGEAGLSDAVTAREQLPAALRDRYLPEPFLTHRMADALVAADLVLGRAGSSTCAEVAAAGVASILVPYPHAGAHQRANAAYLAEQRAAVLVADEELDPDRLASLAADLRDDGRRGAMAAAARRLGQPDAARHLALALVEMAA